MMRSPMSARRCTRVVRVLITTRCANSGRGQALHVVGDGVIAAFDQGQRLRRRGYSACEPRGLTPSASDSWLRVLLDDGEHVIDQRLVHGDALHGVLQLQDVVGDQAGCDGAGDCALGVAQDLALAGGIGIADAQAHQEAVELRFGQRIGAVVLHRDSGWRSP